MQLVAVGSKHFPVGMAYPCESPRQGEFIESLLLSAPEVLQYEPSILGNVGSTTVQPFAGDPERHSPFPGTSKYFNL